MRSSLRTRILVLVAGGLLTVSQASHAVDVAEIPLFIAPGVTPNVMLVVDNSGSMNSIVWASNFDSNTVYPDWSPMVDHDNNNATALVEAWTPTTGSVNYSTLTNCRYRGTKGTTTATCKNATTTAPSCATGTVRGRNSDGSVTKCLTLPDPVGGGSTRYSGNYLNYLFNTYAGGTNLTAGQIPNTYRMQVARNVATNVVNDNSNLYLGLTKFNTDQGGVVVQDCGSTTSALTTSISGLTASTWTPLAETLYEVTRYFRGDKSYYNEVQYISPILYTCQKNFVVIITDGLPTYDDDLPTNDPADEADAAHALPNWDDSDVATTVADYPNFEHYSDGFNAGTPSAEGNTLYLDDVAKFAYDIDMKTGDGFDDAPNAQQNLVTYTVGFTAQNNMLEDAAEYGHGSYYTANDEDELNVALQAAFSDIASRTSSASAVATNSTRLATDTFIYQARFLTTNWGGQLLAYPIGADGSIGVVGEQIDDVPVLGDRSGWNSYNEMPEPGDRNIYTYSPSAALGSRGRAFSWDQLTSSQQADLNKTAAGDTDTRGEHRLQYLRGDRSNESPSGDGYRTRSSILGDIINSDPTYVARQNYGFEVLPGEEGSKYKTYRKSTSYKSRVPMVYVAANDGMLHGFEASTGVELLAYMPNAVYPELTYLTDVAFNTSHRLINDGAPKAMDAYIGGSWRTILLGSLGGGGKGIYVLDVSDPEDFSADDVMWEFSSVNDSGLGVTIPSPTVARLANGKWAAIVANGYNSGGNAALFIIDLETGALIRKIDTGVGGDNGLSSPVPVDVDDDRITDYVYAGDLMGNMWKFDLTSTDADDWGVAFSSGGDPAPLYTACSSDPCTTTNRQPITARPEVGISPPAGSFVYFGTGRYFADGDNGVGTGANTVYAIRDKNEKGATTLKLPTAGRSKLVHQEVLYEQSIDFDGITEGIRVTTNKSIADADDGWYIDLPASGERQVSTPILRGGRIIFTTIIPSPDACEAGGESWLMELDALTGSRLGSSPFDLNRDGVFDEKDFAPLDKDDPGKGDVPVSGRKSTEGIIKTPGIISSCGATNTECKYASGSAGGIDTTIENAGRQQGRQSWREVQ